MQISADSAPARLVALDSLRGIAASLVVLYHCWLAAGARERLSMIAAPSIWAPGSFGHVLLRSLAAFFEMGRAAVMIFFVLSGFVLACSLLDRHMSYGEFLRKRVLRIYPAFAVAIVASFALHSFIGAPHPPDSVLLERTVAPGMSLLDLAKTLALWGTAASVELDLVVWSLVHEMRISLVFPLLLLVVGRARSGSLLVFAALSLACALTLHAITGRIPYGFVETTVAQTCAVTGYFAVFFLAGIWLALERATIRERLAQLTPAGRTTLVLLACVLLLKGDRGAEQLATILVDYAHGVAAVIMIAVLASASPGDRTLGSRGLQWLGRISYSLYLVHLPIIYALYELLPGLGPLRAGAAAIVASLGCAELLARTVEIPCLALSRRTAKPSVALSPR